MTDDEKLRDYLKRVTVDLHDARLRLGELEGQASEPVAIVGMSCRYPGGISSPEELWEMVSAGGDGICEFPSDRGWDLERLHDPDPDRPGTTYVREGGFLKDAGDFDAGFFSISPREALAMDPQQRSLLEAAWEAFENAGIEPHSLAGSPTGVFVGGASNGYGSDMAGSPSESLDGHYGSGTLSSIMSGRISYALGLEGPALTIDTACSSSLVALHLACGSLRAGESSLALVGGVNFMPSPVVFVELARQRGLAPNGRCKPYADCADGTGWSEGVGMLVLERLSDARRRGHRVLASVRGSAVNQDGASNGLTAPNGPSQQRVIRAALANAGLTARDVDAVEGHGTGTTLGDPIEAQALLSTYGQDRRDGRPLWLGSIKSNIGHTQAAAGVAGVIKMVMALQHGVLPRTLHVDRPSQQVNWSAGQVSLLLEEVAWPQGEEPRRAGVSSFGASGTNAHVIVEEAATATPIADADRESSGVGLLQAGLAPVVLSAREEAGLRGQAARLSAWLSERPDTDIGDIGFSSTRRSVFEHRAVAIAGDRAELLAGLGAVADERNDASVVRGAVSPEGAGGIVFVFPGQGSQWAGMALELLESSDVFAQQLRACGEALAPFVDWSLEDVLRGGEGAPGLERIDVVQPTLFAVMVGLAELWKACGVRPSAVVGHSQGEITAAYLAGALSLGEAARLVALRSQMLTEMVGHGGVASVALEVEQVRERLRRWGGRLVVSGVNGPRSVAVAGDNEALGEFVQECKAEDIRAREIRATVATHSAHVEALHDAVIEAFAAIAPQAGDISFYSTVTGGLLDAAQLDAQYWYRNLREPVEFERVTRALLADGYRTFVEVSPHPVLAVGLHETAEQVLGESSSADFGEPDRGTVPTGDLASVGVHGSLRREEGGPRRFLMSLSELWVRGVEIDWGALFAETDAGTVQLPPYAFQRRRYWLQVAPAAVGDASSVGQQPAGHPILGAALALAEGEGWIFTGRISLREHPWFADHMVDGLVVVPGTTFVELALRAGTEVECECLQDLVFEMPLVLFEDGAVQVQVMLGEPQESGARELGIFSRAEAESSVEERTWTRHARGVLVPAGQMAMEGTSLQEQAQRFAAGSWPPAGAQPVAVDDLYGYFAGVGLEYGPTFLSVQAAWRRGEEAFAEVRLPDGQGVGAGEFGIHPALLDCALQTGGVLMRTENEATPDSAVLPFAWEGVHLYASGTESLRVRLAQLPQGGMSVLAAGENGKPVLSAKSVVVRKITSEQLQRMHGEQHPLFGLRWSPLAASEDSGAPAAAAHTAVLGEHTLACLGGLEDADGDDLAGQTHRQLSDLLDALSQGAAVPDTVLVRIGSDLLGELPETLPATARLLLEQTLSLIQEWTAEERLAGSRLVLITRSAVSTGPEEGVGDLAAASMWGLLRSAQSENPGCFVLLDLDAADISLAELQRLLSTDEPQLALRGGQALAARLARVAEDPQASAEAGADRQSDVPEPEARGSDVPRSDAPTHVVDEIGRSADQRPGTVLITGGTGALGSLLARHLVEHHGVSSLLLASRQGEGAPGAERLRAELIELGSEVKIAACDVSDRGQLSQLIESVSPEHPLSAVVHAAGALEDGVIASMTPERLDRVLAPKLDAAWHLHELTGQLPLSAFILFSSSTGTIGGPAQSNYAAANAFLDALACERQSQGLPGISMAWGWWGDTDGMAAELTSADHTRMQRSGMLALAPEEGLALFDAAYALGAPSVVPARLDLGGMRAQARAGVVPPLLRGLVRVPEGRQQSAGGSLARRLANTPEPERARVVLEFVRGEVASVLGHEDPEAIDVHRAFNELGFDSLTAIELRNRLSGACGVQLPATLAFDYPSSSALSEFLLSQVSSEIPQPSEEDIHELELRSALASIPLARLREAGVLDTLLTLAGLSRETPSSRDAESADAIDELDLESLVELTLGGDGETGESVKELT